MKMILAFLASVALLQAQSSDQHKFVEDARAKMETPGLAAMSIDSSGRTLGYAGELKPDSVLAVGSITKSFTTLMIARLVERGKLSWSDKLSTLAKGVQVLPEYKDVTLEDLLRHRGGFAGEISSYPPGMDFGLDYPELRKDYVGKMLATKPSFAPLSKAEYANANFVLAATFAEWATGKTYEQLIRDEVSEPLKLTSLKVGPTDKEDGVLPHVFRDDKWVVVSPGPGAGNHPALFGADGIRLTLTDFASYAFVHATEKSDYLKAETWKRLHSAPNGDGYGMGVMVVSADGPKIWHNGSNTMNYACMRIDVGAKRAAVGFTNAMKPGMDAAVEDFVINYWKQVFAK